MDKKYRPIIPNWDDIRKCRQAAENYPKWSPCEIPRLPETKVLFTSSSFLAEIHLHPLTSLKVLPSWESVNPHGTLVNIQLFLIRPMLFVVPPTHILVSQQRKIRNNSKGLPSRFSAFQGLPAAIFKFWISTLCSHGHNSKSRALIWPFRIINLR